MADALTPAEARAAESPAPFRRPAATHRARFAVVYAVLAVVLTAAVTGLVLLITRPAERPAPPWSAWRPAATGLEGAREIAGVVASRYRLPSGNQLVGVEARPPSAQSVPVTALALRTESLSGLDVALDSAAGTVEYIFCGLGEACAIAEGEPTRDRLRLLAREALELALYTFTYLDDVDAVVAILPPAAGQSPVWAYFLRRDDLRPLLERPLAQTLPERASILPGELPPAEAALVDRLTEPNRYRFSFQQLQDGSAVLVLDPPNLQP